MMDAAQLDDVMSQFILEIRCVDGTDYPPRTLHSIAAGILRGCREKGVT